MGYANLAQCVADLRKIGQLRVIEAPIDPCLEMAFVQRRAFARGAPALLFTHPVGCRFPMLANLYGTKERINYIFRDALENAARIIRLRANPGQGLKKPFKALASLPALWNMRPKYVKSAPVLQNECALRDLPHLVSWPKDGGAFITLPLVLSRGLDGKFNLGMYRIQLNGNEYEANEIGLHYQLQRGIALHHGESLAKGVALPVNVHVGGPPALALAAVMPMPEGMSELLMAGLLGGRRVELTQADGLPVLAQADFALQCDLGNVKKPEGPFGDHLGYYSLRHDFPVLRIRKISFRDGAIWPFTSVGRPPQEDTMFGDIIHELTAPMVGNVFEGVREIHAVDAAGVHPLLLAIGSERYTPYADKREPVELLTQAMHLLGTTQTALAKFVLIAAHEDNAELDCRDVAAFLRHMLERTDFSRDLHFFTRSATDTLDYSGYELHKGSRLVWAAAGPKLRELGTDFSSLPQLPGGFERPCLVMPGILAIQGPAHVLGREEEDQAIWDKLVPILEKWPEREAFPLIVVVDDSDFAARDLANFLWTVFTRADPGRDCYGAFADTRLRHWSCAAPLVIDGRLKKFQAPPLEEDADVARRMEALAVKSGPLAGLI